MKAIVVLDTESCKKIIAKGVASLPEVQKAYSKGIIHIARGTTCAYIYEELTGNKIDSNKFIAGYIGNNKLSVLPPNERLNPITIKNGEIIEVEPNEILKIMSSGDVFIKGGNAIDPEGRVGVLCASREGGTIGSSIGIIVSRGIKLIIPISLRKLIPDVLKSSNIGGIDDCDYATGEKVALFPLVYGKVFTEIEAFNLLFNLNATLLAQGGLGNSEGALVFSLIGEKNNINKVLNCLELPLI